jgi:hypothetical protein
LEKAKTMTFWRRGLLIASLFIFPPLIYLRFFAQLRLGMMNPAELVTFYWAAFVLVLFIRWQLKSWRKAIIIALLCLLPLYLSIERNSQFTGLDETIREAYYLDSATLNQWMMGAFRVSDSLFGPVMFAIRHTFPALPEVQGLIFLKNLHWLTCFTLILWILHILKQFYLPNSRRELFFCCFIWIALLLPTNAYSMKIVHYEFIALGLGVIALLYSLSSIENGDDKLALFGLIASILAANEKLSASPILLFCAAVFIWIRTGRQKIDPLKFLWALVVVLMLVGGLGFLLYFSVGMLRGGNFPSTFLSIFDPLMLWVVMILSSISGSLDLGIEIITQNRFTIPGVAIALTVIALLALILRIFQKSFTVNSKWGLKASLILNRYNFLAVLAVLVIGVCSTYLVQVYFAPYTPILPGYWKGGASFNEVFWHFGALSQWQHLLSFIGYSYASFVNAVPSILWILYLATTIVAWFFCRYSIPDWRCEVLLFFSLLMPLGFGLGQIPNYQKYYNIGLFLAAIVVLLKFCTYLENIKYWKATLIGGACAALLVLEVAPFAPVYAPFRPFWSNRYVGQTQIVGNLAVPPWMGAQEDTMLAGKELERRCRLLSNYTLNDVPCESIVLYSAYYGDWLEPDTGIKTSGQKLWMVHKDDVPPELLSAKDYSRSTNIYQVINRLAVVQACPLPTSAQSIKWCIPVYFMMPYPGVTPEFSIIFRGFTEAWVFRLDRLWQAGYRELQD